MTDPVSPLLAVSELVFGFPDRPDFIRRVSLSMCAGQCWGIIGPNGAGKSTLLRLFAGLLAPSSGEVRLAGRRLSAVPPRDRARAVAFLPQQMTLDLPTPAFDIVLMGRFPHRRFALFEDAADEAIVRQAMSATQTLAFLERPMSTLSGGEARRVHIAAALAQQPRVLLLDEPTASLDLLHQLSIFQILSALVSQEGLLVVVVTHDINLAGRYCSHVILLDDGRVAAAAPPPAVLQPPLLEKVYGVRLASVGIDGTQDRWVVPLRPLDGEPDGASDGRSAERIEDRP